MCNDATSTLLSDVPIFLDVLIFSDVPIFSDEKAEVVVDQIQMLTQGESEQE